MKAGWIASIGMLGLLLCATPGGGDCGSIPFNAGVRIFEPNQRALIAWNGREEILILSTDLSASAPTKVLEVIPLPSKPTVTEGDVKIFNRAVRPSAIGSGPTASIIRCGSRGPRAGARRSS